MPENVSVQKIRKYLTRLHFGGRQNVYSAVRRLQAVQYDPLNVVGRNPDLVLQSRVKGYKPEMLRKELYTKRTLVDGFDKMLCIYPAEDYPYLKRLRKSTVWWYRENPVIADARERVFEIVREKGAVCSDDLHMDEKVNWPWGKTRLSRAALESFWMTGELAIHHKEGARRFYDLAERHFPKELLSAEDPNESEEDYFLWQVLRRVKSVGILRKGPSDAFLGVENFKATERNRAFETLAERGLLTEIAAERDVYYVPTEYLSLLHSNSPVPKGARVIAPLDNLLWDRKLVKKIFGFDYTWEVYVPKEKRKYGYYVLPVFMNDFFAARFEPESFRGGKLVIKKWWWEENFSPDAASRKKAEDMFSEFCAFLGAEGYEILEGF